MNLQNAGKSLKETGSSEITSTISPTVASLTAFFKRIRGSGQHRPLQSSLITAKITSRIFRIYFENIKSFAIMLSVVLAQLSWQSSCFVNRGSWVRNLLPAPPQATAGRFYLCKSKHFSAFLNRNSIQPEYCCKSGKTEFTEHRSKQYQKTLSIHSVLICKFQVYMR